MIKVYEDYLTTLLKESGCKRIYTTSKELEISRATNLGGVIFQSEELEKANRKTTFQQDGVKTTRVMKYKRTTNLSVIIGEVDHKRCESIFSTFLANLKDSIDDGNGNAVIIEAGETDWVDEKDSILNAQIAVQINLSFVGGIYRDHTWKGINEVNITLG